jgi:hypothetical protein
MFTFERASFRATFARVPGLFGRESCSTSLSTTSMPRSSRRCAAACGLLTTSLRTA